MGLLGTLRHTKLSKVRGISFALDIEVVRASSSNPVKAVAVPPLPYYLALEVLQHLLPVLRFVLNAEVHRCITFFFLFLRGSSILEVPYISS